MSSRGFTLLEMVVVVAIIAMVAVLVLPRLPSSDATNLRHSARNLASLLRYLEGRGIASKELYRLRFNLTDSSLVVRRLNREGEETSTGDPFLDRPVLADGIQLADVVMSPYGKLSTGEAILDFGPTGIREFVTVHLRTDREQFFTIFAYPASGRVVTTAGYQEEG